MIFGGRCLGVAFFFCLIVRGGGGGGKGTPEEGGIDPGRDSVGGYY